METLGGREKRGREGEGSSTGPWHRGTCPGTPRICVDAPPPSLSLFLSSLLYFFFLVLVLLIILIILLILVLLLIVWIRLLFLGEAWIKNSFRSKGCLLQFFLFHVCQIFLLVKYFAFFFSFFNRFDLLSNLGLCKS